MKKVKYYYNSNVVVGSKPRRSMYVATTAVLTGIGMWLLEHVGKPLVKYVGKLLVGKISNWFKSKKTTMENKTTQTDGEQLNPNTKWIPRTDINPWDEVIIPKTTTINPNTKWEDLASTINAGDKLNISRNNKNLNNSL